MSTFLQNQVWYKRGTRDRIHVAVLPWGEIEVNEIQDPELAGNLYEHIIEYLKEQGYEFDM